MSIEVPELVRQRAVANGTAGRRWLEELPDIVARLSAEWDLAIGSPYSGGTAGFVARATTPPGVECVLKVAMPIGSHDVDSFQRSVRVHQVADGVGCVKMLKSNAAAQAVLLERLGPNVAELGFDVPQILSAIVTTLPSFWRPLSEDERVDFPTGVYASNWLGEFISHNWAKLGEPCDRRVIERALAYCDSRAAAFNPETAVLVHGDAHGWNTAQVTSGQYKFVDPEGLFSEPAHDLAVPMREYNEPLLAGDTHVLTRERAQYLADACSVDSQAVWEWGFIERVSTGLANIRDFDNDDGAMFLAVAERCL